MTKNTFLAIAVCLTMIFPSTATAGWLDIIKGIIGGVIGGVQSSSLQKPSPSPSPSPSSASALAPAPSGPPTQEEIIAAIDQLAAVCQSLSAQGFPCAIAEGRGQTHGNALKVASTRSIQEMAKSMGTFVDGFSEDILKQTEKDGMPMDENTFTETMSSVVKKEVSNSQIYLTYTYAEEIEGKKIYVIKQVRVLNAALFGKALEEASQGKSISQQILDETRKHLAGKIIESAKKR